MLRDPRSVDRQAKLAQEADHACSYLSNAFGWTDEEACSRDRTAAVVHRALALKRAAQEGAAIEWSTFRQDGLEELERTRGSPGALRKALELMARESEPSLIKLLQEGSGRAMALKIFQVRGWKRGGEGVFLFVCVLITWNSTRCFST